MADIKADIVRVQCAAAGGTQVVTGDLGGEATKAAYCFLTAAVTPNVSDPACFSMHGYLAQTHSGDLLTTAQYSQYTLSRDNLGTSGTRSGHGIDRFIVIHDTVSGGSTQLANAQATAVADGLSLQWSAAPPTFWMTILLLSGADLDSHLWTEAEPTYPVTVTPNFGLELAMGNIPNSAAVALTAGLTNRAANCGPSMAIYPASTANNHMASGWVTRNAQSNARIFHQQVDDSAALQVGNQSSGTRRVGISNVTGTTFSVDNIQNSPVNPVILALNLGGNGVDARSIVSPASPSAVPVTDLGFGPGILWVFSMNASGYGYTTRQKEQCLWSLALKKKDAVGASLQVADETDIGTTNAKSRYNTANDYEGFLATNEQKWGANITLDANGYTFDWQTIGSNGNAKDHFVVAIEATLGGVGPGPTPSITSLAPDWFADGQQANEIQGTGFEATQGTGKVEVTDGSTTTECTILTWSDTLIEVNYLTPGVLLGPVTVVVTNNSGNSDTSPATHLANLPSSGRMTTDDYNARMNRAAGSPLNPTQDVEFMKHIRTQDIGTRTVLPDDVYGV